MRILISGGAGFVGSSLARMFKQANTSYQVVAFDNLKRRGSEFNLPEFKQLGIEFVHGDVRSLSDLDDLTGQFDLFIEASAEPSVHAGIHSSPRYLLDTNLNGTLNCLDFGRRRTAGMVFLSTSRVYSIPAMSSIILDESPTRFSVGKGNTLPGLSEKGISETFPIINAGFRSLYGSTKLASELFVEEYAANFSYPVVINRCGVIAGRGQFGKTDQGVFTLWVARHLFGGALSYTGFGGTGKQVRDLIHPSDLFSLIQKQIPVLSKHAGQVFAVGGGVEGSASLYEYTQLCKQVTGKEITIGSIPQTASVDIPYFVSDCSKAKLTFDWQPQKSPLQIVQDIYAWLDANHNTMKSFFN